MIFYAIAVFLTLSLNHIKTLRQTLPNGRDARRFSDTKTAFFVLLPLAFLALFRWNVGSDTLYGASYWKAYHAAAQGVNALDFELLFYWFLRIIASFDLPFFWLLFAHSFFFMACSSYALAKGSVWSAWSILVFFLLYVYFDCYSSLRQSLAEAISLIGWAEMSRRAPSWKKDLLIVVVFILAGMMHTTALMNIPLYLICHLRFSRKGLLQIACIAIILTPVIQYVLPLIMRLVAKDSYTFMGFARINIGLSFLIFALCWLFYDGFKMVDQNSYMFANLSLLIFILLLNSNVLYLPFRVFDMLKIGYVFIVPYLLLSISDARIRISTASLLLVVLGAWFLNAFYQPNSYVQNYQTAFENWSTIINLP